MDIPTSVRAVARAGAGTNNIPVAKLSKRGIPVFNAPGANANAVKELVIAGLFLAARNICQAWDYVRGLQGNDDELDEAVEKGKKKFVGYELPGRTLGVIGLGAIGVEVANAAHRLGMRVLGFDPQITVQRAWQLSSGVEQALSLDDLFSRCDMITVHVPLMDGTRNLVNAARLRLMRTASVVMNFARGGIVDEAAVLEALDSGKLGAYVCDFPTAQLKDHAKVVALPHLGASTGEAEENCAVMVADTLRDFLEHGNIRNSVNFPEAILPRTAGATRLSIANENVPNMVGQISTALAAANLNIADLLNKSRGELAYTLIDIDGACPRRSLGKLREIEGVLAVRVVDRCMKTERRRSARRASDDGLRARQDRRGRSLTPQTAPAAAIRSASSIDDIDRRIHELLNERARFAQQVGDLEARGRARAPPTSTGRSAKRRCCARRWSATRVRCATRRSSRLFREIMSACLAQQEPLKVGFLGPEGTFSQQAVLKHFGHSVRALPLASIDEVFDEVQAGHADFGVVPIENSTEGTVNNTLDMFLTSPLKICGEVELRIHQHLMGRMHGLEKIVRVCSHPAVAGAVPAMARRVPAERRARAGEQQC